MEQTQDELPIFKEDPYLLPYKADIVGRMNKFNHRIDELDKNEGGLLKFADNGYQNFGIIFQSEGVLVREWLPLAHEVYIVGEFNDWNLSSHRLEKDDFGCWHIFLPKLNDNTYLLKHKQKIKLYIKQYTDQWVYRNLAYSQNLLQDENTKVFDSLVYNPPNPYKFQHPQPPKPTNLKIYEAHVGMSSENPEVATYDYFTDNVLPRIHKAGYNCVQLMAIMEHAYYGSFGYHVTNFFGVSSRSGDPDSLKRLIDEAHKLGMIVLMDMVHSHASSNALDGIGDMDGSGYQYFHAGEKGEHRLWDSKVFNYDKYEVQRFLTSNIRYWLKEYLFDGFRFDGITSMLYHHHGIGVGFSGGYHEYFGMSVDEDAIIYLMMAIKVAKLTNPNCILIGEDVSGMPLLCRKQDEGGIGFDYRLAMALPDKWIKLLKEVQDEDWSMEDIAFTLTNRRWKEPVVAYAESHDQAIVGDKTLSMWLFDREIYDNMSVLSPETPTIFRGMALHKMIRLLTLGLGGEAYLNFMGNEYAHPEWIDFPREANGWSYHHCRRQWNLSDDNLLRYS